MNKIKNRPLVSIIVPVYNIANYAACCLESIKNQTYQNIEVIVINDGSQDKSGGICNAYGEKDKRFQIIHQKNQGLSAARNRGLEMAQGQYVSFIDGDDYVSHFFIERMLDILLTHNAQISICDYGRNKTNMYFKDEKMSIKPSVDVLDSSTMLSQWYGRRKKIETVSWNKLYDKALFQKQSKDFFPIGKLHEDVVTTHKVVAQAQTIVITSEPLYCYRIRKGSITTSRWNGKRVLDNYEANRSRLEFFMERGYKGAYNRLLEGMIKYELYYAFIFYTKYYRWYRNEN